MTRLIHAPVHVRQGFKNVDREFALADVKHILVVYNNFYYRNFKPLP